MNTNIMNTNDTTNIIVEIVEFLISLVQAEGGDMEADARVAKILVEIVDRGLQAYYDHTGEPLNINLINAEVTV
ncbi:MAG TPA: hypothetical protein VGK48_15085 [Terriglobia bacterium]|jgi:hypothetical protein